MLGSGLRYSVGRVTGNKYMIYHGLIGNIAIRPLIVNVNGKPKGLKKEIKTIAQVKS